MQKFETHFSSSCFFSKKSVSWQNVVYHCNEYLIWFLQQQRYPKDFMKFSWPELGNLKQLFWKLYFHEFKRCSMAAEKAHCIKEWNEQLKGPTNKVRKRPRHLSPIIQLQFIHDVHPTSVVRAEWRLIELRIFQLNCISVAVDVPYELRLFTIHSQSFGFPLF